MRYGFEGTLRKLSKDVEKRMPITDGVNDIDVFYEDFLDHLPEEDRKWFRQVIDKHEGETGKEVYAAQIFKQFAMRRLHNAFKGKDVEVLPLEKPVQYSTNPEGKGMFQVEGFKQPVTFGTLVADTIWKRFYDVWHTDAPLSLRKRYVLEEQKEYLLGQLNRQIYTAEINKEQTNDSLMRALRSHRWSQGLEKLDDGDTLVGRLAEMVAQSICTKVSFDAEPRAPFRMLHADAHTDIFMQTDFLLQFMGNARTAARPDHPRRIGVQITTTNKHESLREKRKGIRELNKRLEERKQDRIWLGPEEVVLIKVDSSQLIDQYREWERQGKPPGGPVALDSLENRKYMLHLILKNYLPEDEISRLSNFV